MSRADKARLWVILALIILSGFFNGPVAQAQESGPVFEDQPAWNCHSMGNLTCGIQETPAGVFRI
jgi:hypothetical protein